MVPEYVADLRLAHSSSLLIVMILIYILLYYSPFHSLPVIPSLPSCQTTPTLTSKRTLPAAQNPLQAQPRSQGVFAGASRLAVRRVALPRPPLSLPFPGTVPVPYEDRNDTQFYKVFFVWFSMNFNILSCAPSSALARTLLISSQLFNRDPWSNRLRPRPSRFLPGNLIL